MNTPIVMGDPNFLSPSEGSNSGFKIMNKPIVMGDTNFLSLSEGINSSPKKRRVLNIENWRDNHLKSLRNSGKEYVSKRGKGKVVAAKEPPNKVRGCQDSCMKIGCQTLSLENIRKLFTQFYELDYNGQTAFLMRCINIREPRCRSVKFRKIGSSKKTAGFDYNVNGYAVCLKTLINVFSTTERRIRTIQLKLKNGDMVPIDKRGRHMNRPRAVKPIDRIAVQQHIRSLSTIESHYSQNSSSKHSSGMDLSVKKMYKLFLETHPDCTTISLSTYRKIFKRNFNLRSGSPREDTYKHCDLNSEKIVVNPNEVERKKIEQDYAMHHMRADAALWSFNSKFEPPHSEAYKYCDLNYTKLVAPNEYERKTIEQDCAIYDVNSLVREQNKSPKKRRTLNIENWRDNSLKSLRNAGKEYVSKRGKGKVVAAKEPPNQVRGCQESCSKKGCQTLSLENIRNLFTQFYELDYNGQTLFLMKCIHMRAPKFRRQLKTEGSFRKSVGFDYYVNGHVVCLKTLINIFSITEKRIRIVQLKLKKGDMAPKDNRGKHMNRPQSVKPEERIAAKQHIESYMESFPMIDSNISSSQKMCKSMGLSVKKMHKLFIEAHPECSTLSLSTYRKVFRQSFKLRFGSPRLDTHKHCDSNHPKTVVAPNKDEGRKIEQVFAVPSYESVYSFTHKHCDSNYPKPVPAPSKDGGKKIEQVCAMPSHESVYGFTNNLPITEHFPAM